MTAIGQIMYSVKVLVGHVCACVGYGLSLARTTSCIGDLDMAFVF